MATDNTRKSSWSTGKSPDVNALISTLRDDKENWWQREWAADWLGEIRDKRAVEPLIASLKDDAPVRVAAARALGEIWDERAFEPLIASLDDQDSDVREAAAHALYWIIDPENKLHESSVEPLIASAKDEDSGVRAAVAAALGATRDKRAYETLDCLLADDEDSEVREAADETIDEVNWENPPVWYEEPPPAMSDGEWKEIRKKVEDWKAANPDWEEKYGQEDLLGLDRYLQRGTDNANRRVSVKDLLSEMFFGIPDSPFA